MLAGHTIHQTQTNPVPRTHREPRLEHKEKTLLIKASCVAHSPSQTLTDYKHDASGRVLPAPYKYRRTMSSLLWAKLPSTWGCLICKQKPDKAKANSWHQHREHCLLVY